MSFPNQMPEQAISTITGLIFGKATTKEQIVLSAYDLVGYGLFLWLGDIKYPNMVGGVQSLTFAQMPAPTGPIRDWFNNLSDEFKQHIVELILAKIFEFLKPKP